MRDLGLHKLSLNHEKKETEFKVRHSRKRLYN